ncbi:hypothetical protein FA13DRAFT_1626740 [Coprinellus micaceus]|uniref:Uncharacterized protein n=1 Tax=Coprinellus micaceus TaxID=71717 RepID=A0A4Y7TIY1_COPMI|nr:hypothetical protein FA13DRAFT_1626740 [Coprinellus micaceus]
MSVIQLIPAPFPIYRPRPLHRRNRSVDSCQGCSPSDVDLSPSAFMALAPLAVGRLHGVQLGVH